MLGEANKRTIGTRDEDLLLQLLAEVEDLIIVAGKVTAEAGEEPTVMSRGANEGTVASCSPLQRLENEILAYQQLLAIAKDEPTTAWRPLQRTTCSL